MRNSFYFGSLMGIGLVYVLGMFNTLMENDSAQFAVMAMRMVQENDFWTLIKGTEEYLDKPHMHYWLAAISYKIFGIHAWAYRLPAILATFLGAYGCFGLGRILYNRETGRLASLVFLTAQTIVLSVIDVRTDAVLTGFTIIAIWQLATYFRKGQVKHALLGAAAAAIAFSTKGQIALLVIGLPLICDLIYNKFWNRLFSWKVLPALLVFGIAVSPMLYAYYQQFDLHPEKVIRGRSDRSGILFIFWEQSFERLSGEGVGKNSSDYFFFFHTFLWVFLPWTILGLWSAAHAFKVLRISKVKPVSEALLLGGIILIFLIISFAQFKLPHYLNICIPLFSVLTAACLVRYIEKGRLKTLNAFIKVQWGIFLILFTGLILLGVLVFRDPPYYILLIYLLPALFLYYYKKRLGNSYERLVALTVFTALLTNLFLNGYFYPELLKYQAGSTLAEKAISEEIDTDNVYKLTPVHTWAFDFYVREPVKLMDSGELEYAENIWLYLDDAEVEALKKSGRIFEDHFTAEQFRISRLQMRFLNPSTRSNVVSQRHLVYLGSKN